MRNNPPVLILPRSSFVLPVLLLMATSGQAALAQERQDRQPPTPAPAAGLAARSLQGDARMHVNRLLDGITLSDQQRRDVDSVVQRWVLNNAAPYEPSEEPPDTTRRVPNPNNPNPDATRALDYTSLEAQVRSLLTVDQQRIWDRNVQNAPRVVSSREPPR